MTTPSSYAARAEEAARLLRAAADGDARAFGEFYDLTAGPVYSLAVARSRRAGAARDAARTAAEASVLRLYGEAFSRAGEHAASGLSALAWLLTLEGPQPPWVEIEETACA